MDNPPGTGKDRGRKRALTIVLVTMSAFFLTALGFLVLGGYGMVITRGDSMAPRFASGDLVIVHSEPDYRVGDVVAYRSPSLSITVLHRVVEVHDGTFVTRGDNNGWNDPDRTTAGEVNGTYVLRIPKLGAAIESLRTPAGGTLLAVLALILTVLTAGGRTRRRGRRHQRRTQMPQVPKPDQVRAPRRSTRTSAPVVVSPAVSTVARPTAKPHTRLRVIAAVVAGALTFLAIAAVWLAPWSAGTSGDTPGDAGRETLAVTYRAATTPGAAYPDGRVVTGDPIFLNLVHTLTVRATHTGPTVPVGLSASLEHPSGWHRAVPLTVTVSGSAAIATLDLDALSATLSGLTRQTGLPTTGTMLVLVPSAGDWAGHATFTFDGVQLRPDTASLTQTRSPAATTATATNTGLLAPLGELLPTWPIRLGATAGLLALAAAGLLWLRQAGADPLRTRRVLQVAEYAPGPGRTVVDLPGAKELARLADAESLPILAAPSGTGNQYVLDDGAVIYRYRPHGTEQQAALGYFADRVAAEIVDRIAYEFRAPLATISGYAEMLNDQIDTDQIDTGPDNIVPGQRKMLAAIDRGVGQLHKMIDDVTVLAELDQPAGITGHVTVDDLVAAATRRFTGIPVSIAVEDGLPALAGDQGKLSWAIGELVAGTIATLTDNGMVGIHAHHDGNDVALTITGHDPAAPPVTAGSHLAHAVAKAVIDQHRGTITTTGRTTTVRLPAPAYR